MSPLHTRGRGQTCAIWYCGYELLFPACSFVLKTLFYRMMWRFSPVDFDSLPVFRSVAIIPDMNRTFPGFSPKALAFFRQLERNNKREWFQPRKAQFEEFVQTPMLDLVTQVVDELRGFA